MNFDLFIDKIMANEAGYSNNPQDKGGETNFGITVAVARSNGYQGAMKDMPVTVARTIYLRRYIIKPGFDRVAALNPAIAGELIDTGVNMGPAIAATFLQRWLNAFSDSKHYQDIFVDGLIGGETVAALGSFLAWRGKAGEAAMIAALNGLQAERYLEIAERDHTQREFVFGWISQRVVQPAA